MWLDYAIVHELRGQAGPTSTDLALIHVRREALTIRVEVRDLPPPALSQQGGEAGGSLSAPRGAGVSDGGARPPLLCRRSGGVKLEAV
jgi:hypothetical protein